MNKRASQQRHVAIMLTLLLYLDSVAQLNTTAQISTQYRTSQTTPKATSPVTSEKSSSVARITVRLTEKPGMF